jgi:putative tryptophan/tyrosine transport system substrate-binding protein
MYRQTFHQPVSRSLVWSALFAGLLGALLQCGCAKKERTYRIGVLSGINTYLGAIDSFKARMSELGYVEGENTRYDIKTVNADPAGERRIAQQFVKDQVDLIFAFPTNPAKAARAASAGSKIPVVFAFSTTEDTGVVVSIRDPGEYLAGVRFPGADLTAKRFEIMCELVPGLQRLWVTYDKNYPTTRRAVETLGRATQAKGVTLVEAPVSSVDEIEQDLEARRASGKPGMDAILVMPELYSQSPRGFKAICDFAGEFGIPVAGNATIQTGQGALFSYAPEIGETGRFAADLAARMLRDPGSIPVMTSEPRLHLDLRQARKLGISIDDGMLKWASKILH